MYKVMMNGRATISRGNADKSAMDEYTLSELLTNIPEEYVAVINNGSDPDYDTSRHHPANSNHTTLLEKINSLL